MIAVFKYCFIVLLCAMSMFAVAQGAYTLSGTVVNDKGEVQKAATVFISGTTKITATNAEGRFSFTGMASGTYQLSVKLLGFTPHSQNVIIQGASVDVKVALAVKVNELKEVVIGPDNWEQHYKMFKDFFLGTTPNAAGCVIVNPKVLSFRYSKKKDMLTAEADDFLVIENKSLGYRIRYMLKFYSKKGTIVNYDGESVFEDLKGDDKAQKRWQQNRANAYRGSFMHFARAVFSNTVLQEGFVAYALRGFFQTRAGNNMAKIQPKPIDFDTLAIRMDSALVLLRFKSMFVTHNPQKAARIIAGSNVFNNEETLIMPNDSFINLYLNVATIDARGSYGDYRSFLRQGLWGRQLMADKLPYEYEPPNESGTF